ncbi:sigma-54-dependent Fis family transcriptional regulator [Cupriavidus cauae]|uniref:sigma-54-dependent Fis family transcriptional regulator n=1 Tax=Cupriavidus cauae TaxID=2608999 RepID=UPI002242D154|nr:sigma-54-dependent Fis family transcriptional regulator [Cupriavidus cauae]UZN50822.1 sigma-54-dependent Fis family transcriptional regulator [Cupriavidus cauae]
MISAKQAAQRHAHVEQVLTLASQADPARPPLSEIERSWIRCVNEYGMDPGRRMPAHIVEAGRLREHKDQIEDFLGVARTGMEQLYKRMSSLGYVLLLTDSHGIAVDFIGNDQWDRELKSSGLYLGADWSERQAGTCAVGTCIVEQHAVTCHQTDHFDVSHISLTCNSAPLFDPTGGFLGVLDVSALTSPGPRESQHLALQMTAMYAQMIEDANFLRYFRDRWILRLGATWSLVDVSGEIMVAFDADGIVCGINSGARRALRAADHGPVIGRPLTMLFRESMSDLWRIARAGMSSDRATLRTHGDEVYYASAIAPRVMPHRIPAPAAPEPGDTAALDALGADDAQMQRLITQAKRLANKPLNVLIHGETGTGKEVLAKALHQSSNRREHAFIAVNCAAIPETLIESELFGYTAGTFTGARGKGMRGLIAQSDGGTLFLDEIGDMPLHLQSRLLRVLSEREVTPLGAQRPVAVDLRVVAASHRDLRQLIAEGRFREDLYYRLCGATLYLPTLRERQDKAYLIERICQEEAAQLHIDATLSNDAWRAMLAYDWPGNVRQLRNVLRFALAMSDGGHIDLGDLPPEVTDAGTANPPRALAASVPAPVPASMPTSHPAGSPVPDDPKARQLLAALQAHHWNVTEVAAACGISRATVYRQMERFGIVAPNRR